MFYEIKLKVEKENSKGEKKEVIEHFITDVVLFAEAEKKDLNNTTDIAMYSLSPARKSSR